VDANVRGWLVAVLWSVTAHAAAQAPVEERRPTPDDVGIAQQRVEFRRQALERAEAEVRDALAAQRDAARRFAEAKSTLDTAGRSLDKARAAAAEAKRAYDKESSQLDRQRRRGSGG